VIEATSIGGRRSDFFTAEKLAPGNLGLLQQNLSKNRHHVLAVFGRNIFDAHCVCSDVADAIRQMHPLV
jgi:hypothetical protein